jgi:glycosyltransferase involved in cell wall biosynthesis
MPLVSIVVPVFDRLAALRDTVASVFAQTCADFELIIADDGSGPETRAWLESLADPRVRIMWLAHSGSPAATRNAGIEAAGADYVAFLDSDDLWLPAKLQRQLEALRANPECEWAYCAFTRVDERGVMLADEATRRWEPHAGDIFAATVTCRASIRTPCVIARRESLIACGGFDAQIAASEDYDLWMRLAMRSPVALVDEPLVKVRVSTSGYSSRWPHVTAYQIRSIEKLQQQAPPRWQRLLRRRRASLSVALAREYRARRGVGAAWHTWRESLPFSWRYPETWTGAVKVLLGL